MAISSSVTNSTNTMWQQLQAQQPQREAARASQTARTLQTQASAARAAATQAQNVAQSLETKASQAQTAAAAASRAVQSTKSTGEMQSRLDSIYTNLPQMVTQNNPAANQTQTISTNATVGTLVNTTA